MINISLNKTVEELIKPISRGDICCVCDTSIANLNKISEKSSAIKSLKWPTTVVAFDILLYSNVTYAQLTSIHFAAEVPGMSCKQRIRKGTTRDVSASQLT